MVRMRRGENDERIHTMKDSKRRRTQHEYNDHEHGGEEHGLDVDLVHDLVEGQQRRLAAVEHDPEATKDHAKRENREPPLRADMGGYASWRSRAGALSNLVGRQRDEGNAESRSLPDLMCVILDRNACGNIRAKAGRKEERQKPSKKGSRKLAKLSSLGASGDVPAALGILRAQSLPSRPRPASESPDGGGAGGRRTQPGPRHASPRNRVKCRRNFPHLGRPGTCPRLATHTQLSHHR